MITKTRLAHSGIAIVIIFGLIDVWILDENYQAPWFLWVPMLAILFWSLWALRDPPDPKAKMFDFNPKRGLTYFLLGFLIFPLLAGLNLLFGDQLSFLQIAGFTLLGSIFIGVVGMFTEHVGV